MRRVTIAAALITVGLIAPACGTARAHGPDASPRGVLTIANSGNTPWPCGFNPFNGSAGSQSLGPVYEPLAFVDALQNGTATPWLATSWRWGQVNRSLSFTIRKGVTFTDGTPAKGLAVGCTCPQPGLVVSGDPGQLDRLLMNLLSNAVKFTPEGGRIHPVSGG